MSKFSAPANKVSAVFFRCFVRFSPRFALKPEWVITCMMVVFGSQLSCAQPGSARYDPALYRDKPVWVDMMQDPAANFYEAVKAFRTYWEGYELPEEPEEMEAFGRFKKDIGLKPDKVFTRDTAPAKKLPKRLDAGGNDLLFEVKQFKGWYRNTQPWVQPNGHIMTPEERQRLIDRQQEELKAIESKQKGQ